MSTRDQAPRPPMLDGNDGHFGYITGRMESKKYGRIINLLLVFCKRSKALVSEV